MTWSLSRVRRQLSIFFLSSVTRAKKKNFKKKKEKLLNYVMTWSLSRVRWQLSIFCWVQSCTYKKKKKKKRNKKKIIKKKKEAKENKNHQKGNYQKKIIKKKKKKRNYQKKKICWTTWWLDSSPGYVRSLVLVTEFSHMKRRRIASLAWRVFQWSSICF